MWSKLILVRLRRLACYTSVGGEHDVWEGDTRSYRFVYGELVVPADTGQVLSFDSKG
jgi:hypothetical protein